MAHKYNSFEQHLNKVTIIITEWIGTPQSILLHTCFFILIFGLLFIGVSLDKILLILTTAVSLEAIYLALFIQMTVNRNTESLEDVEENIDEIQEDVQDLEQDVDEIQENVDEIQEDHQEDEKEESLETKTFASIEQQLSRLASDLDTLKQEIASLRNKSM